MKLERLGDRINIPFKESTNYRLQTFDTLAQNIFWIDLSSDQASDYYITTGPQINSKEISEVFPPEILIGEYERLLLEKFTSPIVPVICITGQMGSGKSTTLNYVINLIHIYDKFENRNYSQKHRLIARLDFNQQVIFDDLKNESLTEALLTLICDEIQARIRIDTHISIQEEFTQFWQYEIKAFSDVVISSKQSKAFRRIISSIENNDIFDFSVDSDDIIKLRINLVDQIKNNKDLYLDYLLRLWKYVNLKYFESKTSLIVFDNLDRVTPLVQRKVLDIVMSHSEINGPTFILLVRPETFDRLGLSTKIFDVIHQAGPRPYDVILDRLHRYNTQSSNYKLSSFSISNYSMVKDLLRHVEQIIIDDKQQSFSNFINAACGKSIRSGLILACNILGLITPHQLESASLNIHKIKRVLINQGESQYRFTYGKIIQNIFRTSRGIESGLLIKIRILKYLISRPNERAKLGELLSLLVGFGYQTSVIIEALNDLMTTSSQLVRSSIADYYSIEGNDIQEDIGSSVITLTLIGEGYIKNLVIDMDYIEEIMLDAYLDLTNFPITLDFYSLLNRFQIMYIFLNALLEIDCKEMKIFLNDKGMNSYFNVFGNRLISLDIIQQLYLTVIRILNGNLFISSESKNDYLDLIEMFRSLVLQAESRNNDLLGIWVQSVEKNSD